MSLVVRAFSADDLLPAKHIIAATGLFPPDMLDEMVAGFLNGAADEIWLVAEESSPVGLLYCAPERMTSGTWNVLLIAVVPERQRNGAGKALMQRVEQALIQRGARVLLVETSSLPEYERTRRFYRRLGYDEEARIREYYAAGEDKIVFRKAVAERS